jgi:hypothetical protein
VQQNPLCDLNKPWLAAAELETDGSTISTINRYILTPHAMGDIGRIGPLGKGRRAATQFIVAAISIFNLIELT